MSKILQPLRPTTKCRNCKVKLVIPGKVYCVDCVQSSDPKKGKTSKHRR